MVYELEQNLKISKKQKLFFRTKFSFTKNEFDSKFDKAFQISFIFAYFFVFFPALTPNACMDSGHVGFVHKVVEDGCLPKEYLEEHIEFFKFFPKYKELQVRTIIP